MAKPKQDNETPFTPSTMTTKPVENNVAAKAADGENTHSKKQPQERMVTLTKGRTRLPPVSITIDRGNSGKRTRSAVGENPLGLNQENEQELPLEREPLLGSNDKCSIDQVKPLEMTESLKSTESSSSDGKTASQVTLQSTNGAFISMPLGSWLVMSMTFFVWGLVVLV